MYGEDLDWAFRIKRAGWRVLYNGRVDVLHLKRQSTRQNPRAQQAFYESMLIFFRKHYAQRDALAGPGRRRGGRARRWARPRSLRQRLQPAGAPR